MDKDKLKQVLRKLWKNIKFVSTVIGIGFLFALLVIPIYAVGFVIGGAGGLLFQLVSVVIFTAILITIIDYKFL